MDVSAAPAVETAPKTAYRDTFQDNVGRKLEDAGKKLEGKGKNILYGIAALAVLGIIFGIFYVWNQRSSAAAQTALGKAIQTSQAPVTDTPPQAATTEKYFATDKARAEAAIAEFQSIVDNYGGEVEDKAKYFIAVNRLKIDRGAAVAELEALAGSSDEVGKMAKFALAQAKSDEGKSDEAVKLYEDLVAMDNPIIAKETIRMAIAEIYEKQGKKQEAADLYFEIAKTASEAKDADGKPIPMSTTARSAKEKLEELDPERAKQIVEPELESPLDGSPFGM